MYLYGLPRYGTGHVPRLHVDLMSIMQDVDADADVDVDVSAYVSVYVTSQLHFRIPHARVAV